MTGNHTLFTLAFVLFTYRLAKMRPKDRPAWVSSAVRAALQAAVLLPLLASRDSWHYVAAMIAAIGASDILTAGLSGSISGKHGYAAETVALFARVAAVLIVAGNPRFLPGFNGAAGLLASWVRANSSLAASVAEERFHDLLVFSAGVLLAGFEVNCVVALVLERARLLPTAVRSDERAARESGRGRIIGILERSIAFVLAVEGHFSAIGLIVAAKAIARFKELDDRDFAEYVLIGTLLSIALAVASALFLRRM